MNVLVWFTAALKGLVQRFDLEGERLGEVAAGAVMKHSRDFNLAREATLDSGLSLQTPAYDVQQACGTGLEAASLVGNKIALGQIDSGIAGGTDTALWCLPYQPMPSLGQGFLWASTVSLWLKNGALVVKTKIS